MRHALRHVECLPNPSALAGARWGGAKLDMRHALRHVECLPNPSALAGARWSDASKDSTHTALRIVRSPVGPPIYQTQVSTRLSAIKRLKTRTDSRV